VHKINREALETEATGAEIGRLTMRGQRWGEAEMPGCDMKAAQVQQMRVLPEELSIRLGSYRHGGEGNRPAEAGETRVCFRQAAIQRAVAVDSVTAGFATPKFRSERAAPGDRASAPMTARRQLYSTRAGPRSRRDGRLPRGCDSYFPISFRIAFKPSREILVHSIEDLPSG